VEALMYRALSYITASGSLVFLICLAYQPLRNSGWVLALGLINLLLVLVWFGLRSLHEAK
jgi:hypothetical protein